MHSVKPSNKSLKHRPHVPTQRVCCIRCEKPHDELERLPKLFGCGHTFCLACAKKLLSGPGRDVKCPACQCGLHKTDAVSLMTNHALVTLMRSAAPTANKPVKRSASPSEHKKKRVAAADAVHPNNLKALEEGRTYLDRAETDHQAFYDTFDNMHTNSLVQVRLDIADAAKLVRSRVTKWHEQCFDALDAESAKRKQELAITKQTLAQCRVDANATAKKAAHSAKDIAHELEDCIDDLSVDHLQVLEPGSFVAQLSAGSVDSALYKLLGAPEANRFRSVAYGSVNGNEPAEE